MVVVVKNLKRPGVTYDSTKLAQLGNMIVGSMKKRTKGKFIGVAKISGNQMNITIKELNEETGKYVSPTKDEQTLLAGRVASFLSGNGITSEVAVK